MYPNNKTSKNVVQCMNTLSDYFKLLQVLADNCSNIQDLNLSEAKWIDDELIMPLLQNNHNITSLDLSGCLGLSSRCLQPTIISCKVSIQLLIISVAIKGSHLYLIISSYYWG